MSLSMYQASVPVFTQSLTALSKILTKAVAHAEAKKIEPGVLLNARLYPDMFPLTRQVQLSSDNAKGPIARLAGVDPTSIPDTETTFEDLQTRITRTIDILKKFTPEQIDGSEDREVTLTIGGNKVPFQGGVYLTRFALPNFYFHVATAYNILRHNGVEIGKRDFLGAI